MQALRWQVPYIELNQLLTQHTLLARDLVSQASRIFPSERTAHARVKYAGEGKIRIFPSPAYFTRACAVRSLGKIRLACETTRDLVPPRPRSQLLDL